jgi:hypothetical protein
MLGALLVASPLSSASADFSLARTLPQSGNSVLV